MFLDGTREEESLGIIILYLLVRFGTMVLLHSVTLFLFQLVDHGFVPDTQTRSWRNR